MSCFRYLIQKEWVWLTGFTLVLLCYMQVRGELTLKSCPDSGSYLQMSHRPVGTDWLTQNRTVGYPLFLKTCRLFFDDDSLPVVQFLTFASAVLLFSFALKRINVSSVCNIGICLALLYKSKTADHVNLILTDLPAYASAIATIACTFAVIKPCAHKSWWIGLAMMLFCSYQMRPVYLCLIPVIILSLLSGRWLYEWICSEEIKTKRLRFASLTIAMAVVPFFCFCSMRYLLVDHFGLVSFGGYNIIGIAGSLLEEDDVKSLSPDIQPLAQQILIKRNDAQFRKDVGLSKATWQPVIDSTKNWNRVNQHNLIDQYNTIIWQIAVPEANQMVSLDKTNQLSFRIRSNQLLTQLSHEVLSLHKVDYGYLVGSSLYSSVSTVYTEIRLIYRLVWVWMVLLIGRVVLTYFVKKKTLAAPWKKKQALASASIITIVSLLYYFCNIGLVIAVEPPIRRYVVAAAGLLPAIGIAFAFFEAEIIRELLVFLWKKVIFPQEVACTEENTNQPDADHKIPV